MWLIGQLHSVNPASTNWRGWKFSNLALLGWVGEFPKIIVGDP